MKRFFLAVLVFSIAACSPALCDVKATIDPLDIGVGTRALGMGKAFIGAADDTSSIFLNPAGLAYTHDWGVTSMYSDLISEITYTTIGVHKTLGQDAIGIGYVGANIGGNIFTTYRDPITDRILPLDTLSAAYNSSVFLFTYSTQVSKYLNFPQSDKLMFGASLKLFYQSLKATEDSYASGHDVDLGLIYKAADWLKVGFYGQNLLPNASGSIFSGNLVWNSGAVEAIPANYKLGMSFKALGEDGRWKFPQDLFWNLDMEQGALSERPVIYHTGLEWWANKALAFRVGIDQDVYSTTSAGDGVDNNLTFGLGFWYGDFGLDYAYHQYGPLTENVTHYFSISYNAPSAPIAKPKAVTPEESKDFLFLYTPDRTIIYSDYLQVSGEVLSPQVERVLVNDQLVDVVNEHFSTTIEVKDIGKNSVNVKCTDVNGEILKEYPLRVLRLPSFTDVPDNFWAKNKICVLAALKLIGGYPDGSFRPNKQISRSELTVLLVRTQGGATPESSATEFKDVPKKHWASFYVKTGVDRGLVSGYPDKTFKPARTLSRAEGVTILSRFSQLSVTAELTSGPFPDVPGRHWAAKQISAAKAAGLLIYLTDKPFEPNKSMTRAEAAEILSETPYVKAKQEELFNWDVGY